MRLLSAVLSVALTGSFAVADEAKPADPKPEVTKKKVPYRVVKTLPETGQVLLFDRTRGTHVVAEVGQTLDGYYVEDIEDDEVTLVADSGTQVILTAPPPPRMAKRATKKAEHAPPAPIDPYGDDEAGAEGDDVPGARVTSAAGASTPTGARTPAGESGDADSADVAAGAAAPVDPYADVEAPKAPGEGGVRVASAAEPSTATAEPAEPYDHPGIAAFAEAVGAAPGGDSTPKPHDHATHSHDGATAKGKSRSKTKSKAATTDAGSELAALATGAQPIGAASSSTSATTAGAPAVVIARSELDAALADFGRLAGSFKASFTSGGLRFDAVSDGTLLAKAGLRKGDVVTSVDGQPLRSLDDAANLYARAGTIRSTTVQLLRAGKPITLRIAIH